LPISPALVAGLFGRPFAVDAEKTAVSPRRLGKREEASLEEFAGLRGTQAGLYLRALSVERIVVPALRNRSMLSRVCRSAV